MIETNHSTGQLDISPREALDMLLAGNARFRVGELTHGQRLTSHHRDSVVSGQAPFGSIVTCADSRTPPEHLFDAGLGDLFVCRNAGNLLDEAVLGSLEYASTHLGSRLACVMGHSSCGAVAAAVAAARGQAPAGSSGIDHIIRALLPAVTETRDDSLDEASWTDEAARRNVIIQCSRVQERSPLLAGLIEGGRLGVAGLWYDLKTGIVEVLMETGL
jgi:carbonic anhydrase